MFKALVILVVFIHIFQKSYGQYQNVKDTSLHRLSRQKRWLVWKDGVNWVSLLLGIGVPVPDVQEGTVTLGMLAKAYYEIPNNSSQYTHPSIDLQRKKRSATRWGIYKAIQAYLDQNNYGNGKSCMLKSICEAAASPLEKRSGLLAEILHTILTPSSTDDELENHVNNDYYAAEQLGIQFEDCDNLFPECERSVFQQFSRLII